MSSRRRMKGFGQQSIAQRYGKQDVTITETITLMVFPGMEEEEEADSRSMGADLRVPVCETKPAYVLMVGEVSKLFSTY